MYDGGASPFQVLSSVRRERAPSFGAMGPLWTSQAQGAIMTKLVATKPR